MQNTIICDENPRVVFIDQIVAMQQMCVLRQLFRN